MADTVDKSDFAKLQATISNLVPGLFAAFQGEQLSLVFINKTGHLLLCPAGRPLPENLSLNDIIGINDIDRFRNGIFPQAHVLGSWAGSLALRDMLGREFTCRIKLLDTLGDPEQRGRWLYLHADPSTAEEPGQMSISDSDMLTALLETVPDMVYFKDASSRFLRASRSMTRRFSLPNPRDIIGKTDFDFYTPEHAAPAFEDEQRVIKANEPLIDHEEKETLLDGTTRLASTTKMPFRNREGKLIGIYGITRDITEQKKVAEAIRRSESILQTTISAAPIGIALLEERTFCKANQRLEEITGYQMTELLGETTRTLYATEEDYNAVGTALYKNLSMKRRAAVEATWLRKHGGTVDVLLEVAPLELGDGRSWSIVTVLDITQQKQAAAALREGEALFRAVFDGSRDAVLLIDDRGSFMNCNALAAVMFGYSKEKLLQLWIPDISPPRQPDDRASSEAATSYIGHAQKHGYCRFEWMHRRSNGLDFPAEVTLSIFEFRGRRFIHCSVQDITERKQAEDERRSMETRLQLSSKLESVGSLAAGVAHEINTPTQFISDNISFLLNSFAQIERILDSHREQMSVLSALPESAEALARIKAVEEENELDYLRGEIPRCLQQSLDGLRRISKIVGSLKEFSHPGGSARAPADINHAIDTTVAVSKHEWKYVADVVTELDPQLPKVTCTIDEINQAVLNLIINATHAIDDANKSTGRIKGTITLRTHARDGRVVIEVEDNGSGIPEHARDRIFEPFFTTKPIGKGTGQGLAIVQAVVVQKHGGDISFTTEPGRGTTFRMELPVGTEEGASGR